MAFTHDTNILLHLLRNSGSGKEVRQKYFDDDNQTLIISIVTQGEIESIALQRNYGKRKLALLKDLLRQFLIIPVYTDDIVDKYAQIDAFSQGNHPKHPLPDGLSARNMSRKNDLWIAATASVTQTKLITADSDFDHLHNSPFLSVIKVNT